MKTVKHFFRKYFLSTILILLLFLLVNAVLVAGLFYVADSRASSPDLSIEKLADMVSVENGKIQVSEEMAPLLHTKNAWAMLLNENGMVLWEENLPAGLPHSYDATQIAKFSKWYLGDFPVLVWEHPAGLFVVGYPPDSVVKYNFVLDRNYVSISLIGTALVFVVNILLMLLLFWHNTHRVEKAVGPILTGIETMAGGKEIQLAEQGELAEINAGLNKAASQLAKKDSARAEWINGISHDIRTPLSIMLGYAGEIEDDNKLPTDTRAQAEIICKQGERLRKLVADLNLASKLEYSMQPMNRTLISPVE
ncbi:sensor histidine kinase, partial [Muricomes intestini]|uniref:sensor histidine kinase n=2 Tax=Clostridia TaxID=186801 RepID=UPI002FE0FE4E